MEKWILRNKNTVIPQVDKLNLSKYIIKILINRGYRNLEEIEDYIYPEKSILKNPFNLKDFNKVIDILKNLKDTQEKIRIIGDYDVDGIVSVYILYTTFKNIGLNVDFTIPHRVTDGYGINKDIVKKAKEQGVTTLITCDNGISAIDSIEYAKDLGLKVIVTDHHDVKYELNENGEKYEILPKADAILNPKQKDCNYTFKKLCGAGVCFKLCSELYKIFNMEYNIEELYEFAAIATICDVVDLEDENRYIVKKGMELINKTSHIGLNAIIDANELEKGSISSYEIGYVIGPCLNALGRLESAKKGLELLLCENVETASILAAETKELNDKRKFMTVEGVRECIEIIKENSYENSNFIVIYNENIHESIAGIIAGRIKEKYYKPTIVITKGEKHCKGSGRSIEGIDIFDILLTNSELLNSFGGHPMAAGLSIESKNINKFRENLNNCDKIKEENFVNIVYVDLFCPIEKIDYKFVKDLSLLEPFGKSNIKPIIGDKGLAIRAIKRIGKNKNFISLMLTSKDGKNFNFIYFGDAEEFDCDFKYKYGEEKLNELYNTTYCVTSKYFIDILYEVKIDNYRFTETIKYFLLKYRF